MFILKRKLSFGIFVLAFAETRFQIATCKITIADWSVLQAFNHGLRAPLAVTLETFVLSIFCFSVEHPATSRRFIEFGRCANDLNNSIFL